jgi:very-short-patch-repair endonuclease
MGTRPDHIQGLVFERHRGRRAQGVPTLSVLVGDADPAEWCWSRWQRARSAAFACVAGSGLAEMLGAWFSRGCVLAALRRELLRRGAAARGVSCEEFGLTLGAFVRGPRRQGVDELSAWLGCRPELVAIVAGADAEALPAWALAGFPRALAELERALPDGLPGLFVRASVGAASSVFDEVVASLIQLAEAVPRLELAMNATSNELAAWRQRADARERHLVAEGSIRLEAAHQTSTRRRRPSAEIDEAPAVEGAHAPATRGATPRLEYDAAEFARSRAERMLFEHLEGRTRTRGLFRLNGTIPEPFGGRHLEVDLLSDELRVALEVDGYHHFRDATAYRRDRDKDVRLQRLGYTVVRVLATDVDVELDYVTDTIDRVVDHEKQKRAP